MKTTVTLVHKNCGRACHICAYGKLEPVGYDVVVQCAQTLMRQGYRVHLYDFDIGPQSIAVFRRTRQFEGRNPGWMNVGPDFDPSPEDLGYLNDLRTVARAWPASTRWQSVPSTEPRCASTTTGSPGASLSRSPAVPARSGIPATEAAG